jgi:hypothetical protein
MTDDELDRALFALPLEEPPADLHGSIMAATAWRPAPAFRAWELWLAAGAFALVVWLTMWIFASSPGALDRLEHSVISGLHGLGLFSRATYVWIGIGLSSVWWISSLSFMPVRRVHVYNR